MLKTPYRKEKGEIMKRILENICEFLLVTLTLTFPFWSFLWWALTE